MPLANLGAKNPVKFKDVASGSQWLRQLRERLRYFAASVALSRPEATWKREKSFRAYSAARDTDLEYAGVM